MNTCIDAVLQLPDLRPSPEVNEAFRRLVRSVVACDEVMVDEATRREVRRRCSEAEGHLEHAWSRRISGAASPCRALEAFPYQDNYRQLARTELQLLGRAGLRLSKGSRIAMIGSGPLPLTTWHIQQQADVEVMHIDASAEAVVASERLARRLGWHCHHMAASGEAVALQPEGYDLVLIAGLAGQSAMEKQRIVDNILPALAPGGKLLLRSAQGARGLLYPPFAATDIARVQLQAVYHPPRGSSIINSAYVYGKEDDA